LALDCHPDPLASALARKADAGHAGAITGRMLAAGEGWQVLDYVCTCGPRDRVFQERHALTSVSLVVAGTFLCRSAFGTSLLSAGSLFLGSAGKAYECSHRHGAGDRCLSFQFEQGLFERLAHDAGAARAHFERDSLPPLRAFAAVTARAQATLERHAAAAEVADVADVEEAAYALAATAARAAGAARSARPAEPATCHRARIADVLNHLGTRIAERHSIAELARVAGLSPYHFLRMFKQVTGVPPHQWLLRARLRRAAQRLLASRERITDIALEVGFEDLSNFVRTFRAEFGISPRGYRGGCGR
jgi:AraC-like DNA-binding protein